MIKTMMLVAMLAWTTVGKTQDLEEIRTFCLELVEYWEMGNPTKFFDAFDTQLFYERLQAYGTNPETDKALRVVANGFPQTGRQLYMSTGEFGHTSLLKVFQKGEHNIARFRFASEEGLNYVDFVVKKRDGNWRFADGYSYTMGNYFSQTVIQLLMLSESFEPSPGFVSKVLGIINNEKSDREKFADIIKSFTSQNFVKVGELFESLPEEHKKNRILLHFNFLAAKQSQNLDFYQKAADIYIKHYPKDPSLNLLLLDIYTLKEDFDSALKIVKNLQEQLEDPYLELYNGNLYMAKDDIKTAIKHYELGNRQLPDMLDFYDMLFITYNAVKDYEKLAEMIIKLERKDFKVPPEMFLEDPYYTGFTASEPFKKWIADKSEAPDSGGQ